MAPIRAEAAELGMARAASDLFTVRYECPIEQLIELYRNPHWRSSAYGGNPWAEVTGAVGDLQRALDVGELFEILQWLTPEEVERAGSDRELRRRLEGERQIRVVGR